MIPENRFFSSMRTAARGMEAQRRALGASTENIANATTSRTADGTPYGIRRAVHEVGDENYNRFGRVLRDSKMELHGTDRRHLRGASLQRSAGTGDLGPVTEIEEMNRERLEYDPDHPDADADGYVHYPDVNVANEMARMISANRVYEANLKSVKSTKSMIKSTLNM